MHTCLCSYDVGDVWIFSDYMKVTIILIQYLWDCIESFIKNRSMTPSKHRAQLKNSNKEHSLWFSLFSAKGVKMAKSSVLTWLNLWDTQNMISVAHGLAFTSGLWELILMYFSDAKLDLMHYLINTILQFNQIIHLI